MAEIEINALSRQCIVLRVPMEEELTAKIQVWEKRRNKNEEKIVWKFAKQDADRKLSGHYPRELNR
jgi:hypothetical protein